MGTSLSFRYISYVLFVISWLLLESTSYRNIVKPVSCTKNLTLIRCTEAERSTLESFKEGLTDPSGRLSSWVGQECCKWTGVSCSKRTGRVLKLDLRNPFQFSIFGDEERPAYNHTCLGGDITPSLINLKGLIYLDLSLNNFNGTHIPKFLGSLKNLRYLNLSFSSFGGVVPPHLGNLSNLHYLGLNAISFSKRPSPKLQVERLDWLSHLSSLEYLDMTLVNLEVAPYWLHVINKLPSLLELHLANCGLVNLPPSISTINFTSLSHLDLSYNNFNSMIPHWLFNMSCLRVLSLRSNNLRGEIPNAFVNMISLQEFDLTGNFYVQGKLPTTLGNVSSLRRLDLASTNISGHIPSSFGNLCNLERLALSSNRISREITQFVNGLSSRCSQTSLEYLDLNGNEFGGRLPNTIGEIKKLEYLDLSSNAFWGSVPASIGSLSSLGILDLSSNNMSGTIPQSIGKLSNLTALNLCWNPWEGTITEAHFQNHFSLEMIEMISSYSQDKLLAFDMRHDWIPPFSKLNHLRLDNNQVGPLFPSWIQSLKQIRYLSLDNVGVSDTIPDWFWMASNITYLDMSNNKLRGKIPQFPVFPEAFCIDLSSNNLDGPLPLLPTTLGWLYLDNNFFSGTLPQNIDQMAPSLSDLVLSSNSIEGRPPSTISKLKRLKILALRDNNLSGELPKNWTYLPSLRVFDMANNSLAGKVPASLGSLSSLRLFSLGDNNFEGELPPLLGNLTMLISLNLGGNKFNGSLPTWIGEKLSSLSFLSLRSNLFDGNIPGELCLLSHLRVLDLAHNNLSGVVLPCLGNLSKESYEASIVNESYGGFRHMMVVSKGRELFYDGTLYLVNSLDLSDNNLSGEMPENITSLSGLGILNLSMNHLSGRIPEKIGELKLLETFDFSRNKLCGTIPQSLSSMTFLSHLNLSYNNLTEKIPSGNQLQTLIDPSIYEGNPFLCGPPLSKHCQGEDNNGKPTRGNEKREAELPGFYISMAAGFIVGFWVVCGSLTVKAAWRHAYFRFCHGLKERIVVFILVKPAHFRRN